MNNEECDELEKYGIISNTTTALRWLPIIPLLKNLEAAQDTPSKATGIKNIMEFCIKTGLNDDPSNSKLYKLFAKIVDLLNSDPEFAHLMQDALR